MEQTRRRCGGVGAETEMSVQSASKRMVRGRQKARRHATAESPKIPRKMEKFCGLEFLAKEGMNDYSLITAEISGRFTTYCHQMVC
jgi:hypothetical protein